MRVAVLADIHDNLPALEAVLRNVGTTERRRSHRSSIRREPD
jgi:hypothetical protein